MTEKLHKGLIRPKSPCPFLEQCGLRNANCPTQEKPKEGFFSCATARAFALRERNTKR